MRIAYNLSSKTQQTLRSAISSFVTNNYVRWMGTYARPIYFTLIGLYKFYKGAESIQK
jgi:hypothetical protein